MAIAVVAFKEEDPDIREYNLRVIKTTEFPGNIKVMRIMVTPLAGTGTPQNLEDVIVQLERAKSDITGLQNQIVTDPDRPGLSETLQEIREWT